MVGSAPKLARSSHAPAGECLAHADGASSARTSHRALEIAVRRGKDLLAVRHLHHRGRVRLGQSSDSIIPAVLPDSCGSTAVIATADGGRFVFRVPRGTRARVHLANGLARLVRGPEAIELADGDRAVLLCGSLEVRASIVSFEGLDNFESALRPKRRVLAAALTAALAVALVALAWTPPPAAQARVAQHVGQVQPSTMK